MKKIVCISVLVMMFFASCEDVIQIKLDEGSKHLVVDGFINDLRIDQKVRLTFTDSYFSGQNPPPVVSASVILKDLTTNKTYTFNSNNNGDYVYTITPLDTISFTNHSYLLEVYYDGNTYFSNANQNRTTPIDSIGVEFKKTGSFQKEGYDCTMWAKDIPGPIRDYYWIKGFRNDTLFNSGSQINIAIDAANGAGADGLIFTPPIAGGITPFGEVYKLNDKCRAEIHSLSLETYNFLKQVISQTTNSGLFATTPENVKTNIVTPSGAKVKAIGWFNMASVSFKERIIQ